MNRAFVFSCGALALGAALLTQALKIQALWVEPMGPRMFPLAASILMIAAAAGNCLSEWRKVRCAAAEQKQDAGSAQAAQNRPRTPLWVGLLAVIYILGLTCVGYFVSTFLFVFATAGFIAYHSDRATFRRALLTKALPIAVGLLLVLLFGAQYLHIYLPRGGFLW